MTEHILQTPDEVMVHAYDWTSWLGGDTIAATDASILPAGPTIVDLGSSGAESSIKVSGLTYGKIYELKFEITTTTGAEKGQWSLTIRCGNR